MSEQNVATMYYRYTNDFDRYNKSKSHYFLRSMADIRCYYGSELAANGGYTVVVVRNPATGQYHIGISRCSMVDRFQRKTGREQALDYARQAMKEGKKVVYAPIGNKSGVITLNNIIRDIPVRYMIDDEKFSRKIVGNDSD